MIRCGGSRSFSCSALPSNCCIWEANVSSRTWKHNHRATLQTKKNMVLEMYRNGWKDNDSVAYMSFGLTYRNSDSWSFIPRFVLFPVCQQLQDILCIQTRFRSVTSDNMPGESIYFDALPTWPVWSQKPRQILMKTGVSNTACNWSMVLATNSFKGCILCRRSDSITWSFASWIIFLSFVALCRFICARQGIHSQ